MRPIIRIENLGKQYRIGARRTPYSTLRESLTDSIRKPIRWLRGQRDSMANDFWALRDVSFEVEPGEVVGVIGRNGAGKSTLLKILSRITEPTTGQVDLYGRVGSLLEVGTGFHAELSGRENTYLSGAILGMSRAEIKGKFDEIVAFAEVEKFIDTPVKHYSSGMYVRLAFAVAAHFQPQILIIDEVLAVGDIEFQKKCMGRMKDAARGGSTVILVSHNMGTVRSLCTSAVLLENGESTAEGDPESVIAAYLGDVNADQVERIIGDEDYLCGGDKLRIDRIRLLNPAMNAFTVYWRQPISVALELNVLEPLEDVSLGAGIKMTDGTWFCCFHHDDYNARPRLSLRPGKYTMKLTMRNDLKPGMYKLVVGGHQYHCGRNLCHIETVNLEVLDHSQGGMVPMIYNPGVVDGAATWEGPDTIS